MTHTIDPSIFRAYDIRGIADKNLSPKTVALIGQAIGSQALECDQDTIIIARDGRISAPELSKALQTGIRQSGCNVIDLGAVPTPLLYYATHVLNSRSGVMLTGSHNPPKYNGLKIVINGETLANKTIYALYQRIMDNNLKTGSGKYEEHDIAPRYVDSLLKDIKLARNLKIVIDCGNGIGSYIVPKTLDNLGCEMDSLFCEVDGNFPNHPADPSVAKNLEDLIKTVHKQEADVGIAFDGDVDRIGIVTNKGEIILADRLLMLFAIDVLSQNPKAEIIYDIKCTRHLRDVITEHGGKPILCRTGHSFIKAKINETAAKLAGEMSGHVFFNDRWYGFDDALYAAARLLEILSKDKRSVSEIFDALPNGINTPEIKLPIDEDKKFPFMEKFIKQAEFPGGKIITIDGLRVDYPQSWGLMRPSNTTPYLILRFEGNSQEELDKIQELFRKELLKIDSALKLPF